MIHRERTEMRFTTDSWCGTDGLESFDSFNVKVEYNRSLEYSLKWERPMDLRCSSRLTKASKKIPERKPSLDKDIIQCMLGDKRQRTGLKRTKSGDDIVNADKRGCGILDLINGTHETEHVAEQDEETFVEMVDKGLDESEDDCSSVTSSVASGPSLSSPAMLSQGRCSACQKLYQKAKRMKASIKNKLLDNDPKSLTCDQWVMIKKWRPVRTPNARGTLLTNIQLVKKRLQGKTVVEQCEQYFGATSACSRPHIYLKRNLRRCVKVPVKGNRKRTRRDSRGSRVAKQQHLQSNIWCQHVDLTNDSSYHSASSHSILSGHGHSNEHKKLATTLTELNSSPVILKATRSTELPQKQVKKKKVRGFRDLLTQLCSNSSTIVRETH